MKPKIGIYLFGNLMGGGPAGRIFDVCLVYHLEPARYANDYPSLSFVTDNHDRRPAPAPKGPRPGG